MRAVNQTQEARSVVRLADVFSPACIDVLPSRIGASSVLSQLVSLLVRAHRLPRERAEATVKDLAERERTGTTAIGKGLALPHLRTSAVDRSVGAAVIAPNGINFNSLDGKPTRLILLVLSAAEDREGHTDLLGRLAAFAQNKMLNYLLDDAIRPEQLYDQFSEMDRISIDCTE